MPFVIAWFILLCGYAVSASGISGLMPPLSTTFNAFWYALIPQAMLFAYAIYLKSNDSVKNISHSKTVEIFENENVNKFRQSKEKAEQDRLMKVIEQERKVLGELRKSEARRAEEMRKEKERADDANRAKSAFLAVVSHEIRTPMSGIMGMVKMLLDSSLDKKQKDYAQTIQESSDAMLALLNDILDFEKVEQGKMDIENIGFDIHRLLNGVATLMNGHATQKNIKLITDIDKNLPQYVKGDPTRLRQILLNLTGNAIKFTEEGSVTITARLISKGNPNTPHEVYLSITDSGVGISKEGQKKIFSAFSQADESVNRKFGGTGLGLAISKGLVEAMGSSIHINSNEGEGSTFFFTLNMQDAAGESSKTETKVPDIQDHHRKALNLLIVEDNDINIKVLQGFLEKSPHKIDIARSGEDALAKVDITPYDAIIMDIQLPGMNGDEVTTRIRQHSNPKTAETIIVALSGNVMDHDIQSYIKAGMNDTLSKPVKPEALNNVLNDVVLGKYSGKAEKKSHSPKVQKENIVPTESTPQTDAPVARRSKRVVSRTSLEKKASDTAPLEEDKTEGVLAFDTNVLDTLKGHIEAPQIEEMLNDVFVKSEEILAELKKANAEQNFENLNARAHELKGMTGNFGLMHISDMATTIEAEAKAKNIDKTAKLISDMPTALANAKAAAEKWLKS